MKGSEFLPAFRICERKCSQVCLGNDIISETQNPLGSSMSLLGAGHSTSSPAPPGFFKVGRRPGNNPIGRFYYTCFMRKLRSSELVVFSVSHSWQLTKQRLKLKFSNSSSSFYAMLLNKLVLHC